jgi:DNA-binding XRE family transcriptional regulator
MLPFCDRVVNPPRKDISPVWTRSFPVSKQPQTIGVHLRKRRFSLELRQSEAAHKLGLSKRTLSLWECDKVYPTWQYHARVVRYLGAAWRIISEHGRDCDEEADDSGDQGASDARGHGGKTDSDTGDFACDVLPPVTAHAPEIGRGQWPELTEVVRGEIRQRSPVHCWKEKQDQDGIIVISCGART